VSIFDDIGVEQQLEENQHASTTADLGLLAEKSGSGVDLLPSADRGDLHQQTAHRQPSLPAKRQAEDILHETNALEQRLTRSRCTSTHADAAPTLAALPLPPTSIELTRGRDIDVREILESLPVLKEAPSGGNRQQGEVGTGVDDGCGRFGASEIDASGEQEGADKKRTPLSIIKGNQQGAVPRQVNRRCAVPRWAGGAGLEGKNGEEKETYSSRGKYKVAPSIENEKRVDMFKQGYLALVGGGGQRISYERTAWYLQKCGGVSGVYECGGSVLRVCGCAYLCGECTARCVLGCWQWHCVYRHNAATTWSISV